MTWLYEWLFEPLFISAQRTLSFNNDTTFSNLYILLSSAVSLTFIDFFFVRRLHPSFNRSIIKRQTPAYHYIHSLVHLFIYICLPILACLSAYLRACLFAICLSVLPVRFIFLSFFLSLLNYFISIKITFVLFFFTCFFLFLIF